MPDAIEHIDYIQLIRQAEFLIITHAWTITNCSLTSRALNNKYIGKSITYPIPSWASDEYSTLSKVQLPGKETYYIFRSKTQVSVTKKEPKWLTVTLLSANLVRESENYLEYFIPKQEN